MVNLRRLHGQEEAQDRGEVGGVDGDERPRDARGAALEVPEEEPAPRHADDGEGLDEVRRGEARERRAVELELVARGADGARGRGQEAALRGLGGVAPERAGQPAMVRREGPEREARGEEQIRRPEPQGPRSSPCLIGFRAVMKVMGKPSRNAARNDTFTADLSLALRPRARDACGARRASLIAIK